jgi:hypothetical protein
MSTVEGFGDPKHTGSGATFAQACKDGVQEHRILPPIKNQRTTGKYNKDHTCHYGYDIKRKNSDKFLPNPFYCVEEGKFVGGEWLVTQECPECREIKRVKGEKDSILAQLKDRPKAEQDVATESHSKWLNKHNRDYKMYVNVKQADGKFGTYKYPSKEVWKKIKAEIDAFKTRQQPIDAIDASQGLWFRITRSGKGYNTEYKVEVVTEAVVVEGRTIPGASQPKLAPLTAKDAQEAAEQCLDLDDVGIRRLSLEQVQRLVSSRGDPGIVAAVFGSDDRGTLPGQATPASTPPVQATPPAAAPPQAAPPAQAPAVAPPQASQAPQGTLPTGIPAQDPNPDQAAILAQVRDLLAKARAAGTVGATASPQVTGTLPVPPPTAATGSAAPPPAPTAAPVAPPATDLTAEEKAYLDGFSLGT